MEKLIDQSPLALVVVFLLLGFVLLIKGADFFVEGSSSVAKRFKVPSVIIGLTVVAMGTSLPETAVSVTASLAGKNELAISNAVGSNLFNLMVVIGLCAIMQEVLVGDDTLKIDIPVSALGAVMLLAFGILGFFDVSGMTLGHVDGIIFLIVFVVYLVSLVRRTMKGRKESAAAAEEEEEYKLLSIPKSIIFILGGAAGIAIGGDLTVDAASRIAVDMGMSQTLVGLTIVSIGTSLPELVTSIVAARKKEVGMALGNAVGSNIFNILMVLGIASTISPIGFIKENIIDIVILLICTLLVWIFATSKKKLVRWEGAVMVAVYVIYAVYICIR